VRKIYISIPNKYKDIPWARRCTCELIKTFSIALEAEGIDFSSGEQEEEFTKHITCVSAAASQQVLVTLIRRIQETCPPARLFSFDICETGSGNISRTVTGSPLPLPC